jgi:hypothetical protein
MRLVLSCALGILAFALPVHAQGGLFGASPYRPPTSDKTGTNPLNLQQQIDVTNVYAELDELYLNSLTYRHAVPLLNRRLAIAGSVPLVTGNLSGLSETGLGDIGASVEWTPWLANRRGLIAGLQLTLGTATVDALGLRVPTLMPYAQFVWEPSARTIVSPFVSYRTGFAGDEFAPEVDDTLVGAYLLWRATPRFWVSSQPQIIFDRALDATYGEVGGEVGWQLTRTLSVLGRPSFGLGAEDTKPYSWAITAGVRWIP